MNKNKHSYITRQYMLSSDYEIFQYSDTKLEKISLHHHDFYECYFFISGDVTYLIEGKTYHLKPGDIVLINPRELHQAIINNTNVPYERIVLWMDKAFLNSLSSDKTNLVLCFEDIDKENVMRVGLDIQQNIRAILNKLLSLESFNGIGRDLLCKAYIVELMVHLNMLLFHRGNHMGLEFKKNGLIEAMVQYINAHLEEDISIEEISKHFYLSKYHLLREFKKHTGTTIHKFIVQKKLILAKELIMNNLPITSVYKQCGFGDYSNFFRAFKSEYGVTPKQFYQMMLKSP